jgi:hypothetical protein
MTGGNLSLANSFNNKLSTQADSMKKYGSELPQFGTGKSFE